MGNNCAGARDKIEENPYYKKMSTTMKVKIQEAKVSYATYKSKTPFGTDELNASISQTTISDSTATSIIT